jgi:hypothetical protein
MQIIVTRHAPGIQSQPGPATLLQRLALEIFCLLVFWDMAVPALKFPMPPGERPACALVSELVFAAILPVNQIEIPPGVIRMAPGTVPPSLEAVETGLILNETENTAVTVQAALVQTGPAMLVAFCAAPVVIELLMGGGQRTRGHLPECRPPHRAQTGKQNGEPGP